MNMRPRSRSARNDAAARRVQRIDGRIGDASRSRSAKRQEGKARYS
jgi:hypothetical protein